MSAQESSGAFEALLQEERRYPPPSAFQAQASSGDPAVYQKAASELEAF
jgi:hypothetical protein